MLNLTVAGMLLAALVPQRADFQTDTTFAVPAGTRLSLQSLRGDVVVHTWDRNQVRVQADHSSRTKIGVDLSGAVLRLAPRDRDGMGMGSMVDYELTVPAAMGIEISGMGGDVTIEGSRADVKVNTVEGDIVLKGGGGDISLVTVNGGIRVEGTRGGRLELQAVSDDIEVTDVQGDVSAQTVSGDLHLRGVDGRRVEAQTVSGDVTFDGAIRPDGSYSLSTHSGDVTMAIPEGASAMIRTAIANVDLSASFTLPASERASRTRQAFRLGAGGASIELETFSGDISLVRPGAIRSRNDKED
jgi:DUF4097 and DUF4098 domain-containing protein YvlB